MIDTVASMQSSGLIGLVAALLVGLISSFNPVAFSSMLVVLAYVTKAQVLKEALWYVTAFVAGWRLRMSVWGWVRPGALELSPC